MFKDVCTFVTDKNLRTDQVVFLRQKQGAVRRNDSVDDWLENEERHKVICAALIIYM